MPQGLIVEPIPRERLGWRAWSALLLVVCLGFGIWHVDHTAARAGAAANEARRSAQDIRRVSLDNRQIGYANRAAICDFALAFAGVDFTECDVAAVRVYRDRTIHAGQGERRNTTALLCQILAALRQSSPRCAGVG